MEIIFLIISMSVITVVSSTNYQEKQREQEYKYYSTCLDNAENTGDKELCSKLFRK